MSKKLEFLSSEWQELYKAALFEDDRAVLAARITDAESAIIARVRTLFNQTESAVERKALDRSLHFLRILRIYSRQRHAAQV